MSLSPETAIDRLFRQFEGREAVVCNENERRALVLEMHGEVARHWAETQVLRLAHFAPDERRMRLRAAEARLVDLALSLNSRHGLGNAETTQQTITVIAIAFYGRVLEASRCAEGGLA